nr:N-6 DNA methylase [Rhodopirellula bahusiensis]
MQQCIQDDYFELMPDNSSSLLKSLLKTFADISADAEGDVFGQIYEYFLGNFASAEGQGGGEFFTPRASYG